MGVLRDLGSNSSNIVRVINAIITSLGTLVNPALALGWYRAFIGNMGALAGGSGPTLVGLALVVAMNYEGVRMFQGLYNRAVAGYGAAPSDEQIADAFEGTVVQYIGYLSTKALVNAYPRLPARLQDAVVRQQPALAQAALDQQLENYMAAVPAAQAPRRRASAAAMQMIRNGPASRKTRRSRR
jgi:hypothetical protein